MLRILIHRATLAPSGHNTQPWWFSAEQATVRIFPDIARRLPVDAPRRVLEQVIKTR